MTKSNIWNSYGLYLAYSSATRMNGRYYMLIRKTDSGLHKYGRRYNEKSLKNLYETIQQKITSGEYNGEFKTCPLIERILSHHSSKSDRLAVLELKE